MQRLRFNPITTAAAAECLAAIAAAECRGLTAVEAKQLAVDSGGDLRNAIGMLQLLLCGTAPVAALKGGKVKPRPLLNTGRPRGGLFISYCFSQHLPLTTGASADFTLYVAFPHSWVLAVGVLQGGSMCGRRARQPSASVERRARQQRHLAAQPSPVATRACRFSTLLASCCTISA